MRGFCLRAGVANAIGFKDATSGAARRVFNDLRERGLLEEERPQAETVGRTPYLLRLTERGREAFRALFGQEPVEPEYDRLLPEIEALVQESQPGRLDLLREQIIELVLNLAHTVDRRGRFERRLARLLRPRAY